MSMSFRIADITLDFFTDSPDINLQVEPAMNDFLVENVDPDVRVRVSWDDLSERTSGLASEALAKEGEKLFDSGAVWQLYRQNGSYVFTFISSILGNIPYKIACLDQRFTSGELYLHRPYFNPGEPVDPLEYPLPELIFANLLARGRGAEIHACGVIDASGNGYLFAGQSEAGKTTIARLWEKQGGVKVLSDDRIVLRKSEGRIWMYGTPWHGDAKLASPSRALLKRVYFLKHSPENELVEVKPVEAAARLFSCSFPPFYSREGLDFTLSFLGEAVSALPCYELKFVPDEKVIKFIEDRR